MPFSPGLESPGAARAELIRGLRDAGRPLVLATTGLLLVASLAPVTAALAMSALVDRIRIGAGLTGPVTAALGFFALTLLLSHLADAAVDPLDFLIRARVDGAHRTRVMRLLAAAPISQLEEPVVQQLTRAARAQPDNWTERTPAAGALAQLRLLSQVVGVLAASVVLARCAWWLVPALLAPALLNRAVLSRRLRGTSLAWRGGLVAGARAGHLHELVVSPGEAKEIRIYGLAGWMSEKILHHTYGMFGAVWAAGLRTARAQSVQLALVFVPLAGAYLYAVTGAVRGRTTVEVTVAVLGAGWALFQSVRPGDNQLDTFGALEALRAHRELRDRLSTEDTDPAAEGGPLDAGSIRFEDVSFGYPGSGRQILDGLNLQIRQGEMLAIVGVNGAGKSTLIKLLAGLYAPSSGRITMGGAELTTIGLREWRRRISVVFQDFVRYPLSIAQNVTLGRGHDVPDPAALALVTAEVGLEPLLRRMPAGWETPLARSRTGGVDLSGGQWQHVALARAIYAVRKGARFLILDEPTAHLDVRTEFEIFSRLMPQKDSAGVVLISHRLSTVRQADRIVLLDGGRIAESGTHDQLIELGGRYAEMFAIQAERFHREPTEDLGRAELDPAELDPAELDLAGLAEDRR
jgi:ABC-type multidrug transport system fused ATPase/permease subunit